VHPYARNAVRFIKPPHSAHKRVRVSPGDYRHTEVHRLDATTIVSHMRDCLHKCMYARIRVHVCVYVCVSTHLRTSAIEQQPLNTCICYRSAGAFQVKITGKARFLIHIECVHCRSVQRGQLSTNFGANCDRPSVNERHPSSSKHHVQLTQPRGKLVVYQPRELGYVWSTVDTTTITLSEVCTVTQVVEMTCDAMRCSRKRIGGGNTRRNSRCNTVVI
jgi:hypothetical protein